MSGKYRKFIGDAFSWRAHLRMRIYLKTWPVLIPMEIRRWKRNLCTRIILVVWCSCDQKFWYFSFDLSSFPCCMNARYAFHLVYYYDKLSLLFVFSTTWDIKNICWYSGWCCLSLYILTCPWISVASPASSLGWFNDTSRARDRKGVYTRNSKMAA